MRQVKLVSETSNTLRDMPGPGLTVLQVIPELETGGAERTTIDIARAITRAGGQAIVASEGGRLEAGLLEASGELILIPAATKNPYSMAANIIRMLHIIDHFDVDIVHARSRAPAWSAFAAARIAGVPFVTTYHGTYNARSALKRFYNSVMARGDLVIANSHFISRHIQDTYGLPEPKVVTIPRGTDMTEFNPDRVDHGRVNAIREQWGLTMSAAADDRMVVLLPGRLTPWKGQRLLIEAASILKTRGRADEMVFVLAGDDQGRDAYANDLARLAESYGLAGRVRIVGHVVDMAAAYLASDIVVSPSVDPEAFGRVAVEAQAMGRPVIAADHGGARETVVTAADDLGAEGLATGWRVAPGDAVALADVLIEAADQGAGGRAATGALGQAHVRETFSLELMCASTLKVYRRLAGSPARRRMAAARGITGAEHILVIKHGALGDFIQAVGPMQAIRKHHPHAHITLLTTPTFASLGWASGLFDAVWADGRSNTLSKELGLIGRLRRGGFERVYDLQTSTRSSFYFYAFTPARPEWSGVAAGCSYPHTNPQRAKMHTIERQREQLQIAGVNKVALPDLSFAIREGRSDLRGLGFDPFAMPYALIVPGASPDRPRKRWPAKSFAQVVKALSQHGIRAVIIGQDTEREAAEVITGANADAVSLIGRTSFLQIAALGAHARLALGNDTGPMHILAAAGCPSLVLFSADSDPERCAPRGRMVHTLRKDDLNELEPQDVLTLLKAERLIGAANTNVA